MPDTRSVQPNDIERYWAAVSQADVHEAVAAAVALRHRGVPLAQILEGLVVAAQLRVGELWAGNEWSVAREQAATSVGESVVRRLAEDLPEPTTGPVYLVACVEREWHALPALVVATTLRAAGHRVDYLGASTTRARLVEAIEESRPEAVLLSASLTSSLPRVRRHIEVVLGTGTPVLVGGHAFDAEGLRAQRLGATAYAATVEAALTQLGSLPMRVIAATPLRHPAAREAQALAERSDDLAREVMAAIDRVIRLSGDDEDALSPDDWRVVLATFVPHVVDSLIGAMLTDDASVISQTTGWLSSVLECRGAPSDAASALVGALRDSLGPDHPQAARLLSV